MKNKSIENLQNFELVKSSLSGLNIKGGDCHDTIEYLGDQACKDTYCETIDSCDIVCIGAPPCSD